MRKNKKKQGFYPKNKKNWKAYIWFLPSIILLLMFVIVPVGQVFRMAFSQVSRSNLILSFGTFENFTYLFQQSEFGTVMLNTVIWTISIVVVSLVLSLVTALVLNERFRGRRLARTILLLPWATSLLITSAAWKYILDHHYGYLNSILLHLGLIKEEINFLGTPQSAMFWMIVVGIVVTIPFMAFTLLSGLQSIPEDLYEAAEIDGAGWWTKLFRVTIPLLRPSINVTIVLNVIYVFNSFAIIDTITNGAPARLTHTITTYLYFLAFKDHKYGASAALSLVSFAVLTVFSILYMRLLMKEEN